MQILFLFCFLRKDGFGKSNFEPRTQITSFIIPGAGIPTRFMYFQSIYHAAVINNLKELTSMLKLFDFTVNHRGDGDTLWDVSAVAA